MENLYKFHFNSNQDNILQTEEKRIEYKNRCGWSVWPPSASASQPAVGVQFVAGQCEERGRGRVWNSRVGRIAGKKYARALRGYIKEK